MASYIRPSTRAVSATDSLWPSWEPAGSRYVTCAPWSKEATSKAERVRVEGGSFFDGVPEGGDAYVMKNVIHDWPDAEAVTILKNVRSAAEPGTTLLLVEFVIPDHDREFIGKWVDMEMLVQVAARERTAEDYRKLYEQAGFQMTRVVPTAGPISMVEGKAV